MKLLKVHLSTICYMANLSLGGPALPLAKEITSVWKDWQIILPCGSLSSNICLYQVLFESMLAAWFWTNSTQQVVEFFFAEQWNMSCIGNAIQWGRLIKMSFVEIIENVNYWLLKSVYWKGSLIPQSVNQNPLSCSHQANCACGKFNHKFTTRITERFLHLKRHLHPTGGSQLIAY